MRSHARRRHRERAGHPGELNGPGRGATGDSGCDARGSIQARRAHVRERCGEARSLVRKGFFDIIYGASKGDYGKAFGGAAELLKLAGIMIDYGPGWNDYLKANGKSIRVSPEQYRGLASRGDGKAWHTFYLPFAATSFTPRMHDGDKDGRACFLTLSIYTGGFNYGTVPSYHEKV